MSTREEIARRLTQARTATEMDRKQAAASLGVPYQTYAAHENGNREFDIPTAIQYGRRFKVSLDWLLTGQGRGPGGAAVEAPIKGDVEVLAFLRRIEGLSENDINLAYGVIRNAMDLSATRAESEPSASRDPQPLASRRRESEPSR
ncbi:helix-turn-helix transcriptional regulator [Mesorhizobium sp. SEMIA 3007]|uniref:helix-turn-helix transcriptional regulator n=1 Tax=Mesorhizobium sp. SEMIA 3007 TaxID=1862350 RepID=UPI0009F3AA55|nr:helix-turn-helix transcriptional regulator [Mesorhizobium sp. SEMIA 3007]